MTDENTSEELRRILQARVGGFFHNTRSIAGMTCQVCSGPAGGARCHPCNVQRGSFGAALADRVLTLTYVRGNSSRYHQSAHTMRSYKQVPTSAKAVQDLELMVRAASKLHHDCVVQEAGRPWDAVTFVPSSAHPGRDHPVATLARAVAGLRPDQRFRLSLGPRADEPDRTVLADRFVVDDEWHPMVAGRHVLIVDDTWTTGSKAQSAALAVRAAGAEQITLLCVARWCRDDWQDHRRLLDMCLDPYDPWLCPVVRGLCPTTGDDQPPLDPDRR